MEITLAGRDRCVNYQKHIQDSSRRLFVFCNAASVSYHLGSNVGQRPLGSGIT